MAVDMVGYMGHMQEDQDMVRVPTTHTNARHRGRRTTCHVESQLGAGMIGAPPHMILNLVSATVRVQRKPLSHAVNAPESAATPASSPRSGSRRRSSDRVVPTHSASPTTPRLRRWTNCYAGVPVRPAVRHHLLWIPSSCMSRRVGSSARWYAPLPILRRQSLCMC